MGENDHTKTEFFRQLFKINRLLEPVEQASFIFLV